LNSRGVTFIFALIGRERAWKINGGEGDNDSNGYSAMVLEFFNTSLHLFTFFLVLLKNVKNSLVAITLMFFPNKLFLTGMVAAA
jgi:hypothetical protein